MRRIFFLFYLYLELQPPPGGRTLDSTYLSTSLNFRSLSFFMVVINYTFYNFS